MSVRIKLLMIIGLLAPSAMATHIIGGEIYYDHLGGSEYLITLELFRDCGPSNTQGTGFDASVSIGVFNSSGQFMYNTLLPIPPGGETIVPAVLNNPCLSAPPQVCVATVTYSGVFDLPPIPGGYHITYQRCCRTPAIVNMMIPNEQGITCTVWVPDVVNAENSSPRFTYYPPVVLCMGQDMVVDHSATDPDGDELVYELYTPFHGASNFDPAPPVPTAPPYQPVVWIGNYSANYPLDSDPAIAIDPVAGIMTATPTLIGSFAVGVKVKEFRNGVLLSEVIRDFKFDVVPCEVTIISAIQEQDPDDLCNGLSVSFVNQSVNGEFYFWDFGDPSIESDTSSLDAPSWTYAQGGSFTVTLIANPGWPCADTSQMVFHTSQPMDPTFSPPPIQCVGQTMVIPAIGNFTDQVTYEWSVPPSGVTGDVNSSVLAVSFPTPGVYPLTITVALDECVEFYTDSVVVYPLPVANFESESRACVGRTFAFQDISTAWTVLSYQWDLGDGTTTNEQHPVHEYLEPGSYTVTLTVNTSSGCIADSTLRRVGQVEVYPLPIPGFSISPNDVSMVDPIAEVIDQSVLGASWIYRIEDDAEVYEPTFFHYFEGEGFVTVWQTVITEHGCRDSISNELFIRDHFFYAPNAFTPNGDGLNDIFTPVVKGARAYELIIYDRYGAVVFETKDTKSGWSGDGYSQGIYTYTAAVFEYGSARREYRGHISLLK